VEKDELAGAGQGGAGRVAGRERREMHAGSL